MLFLNDGASKKYEGQPLRLDVAPGDVGALVAALLAQPFGIRDNQTPYTEFALKMTDPIYRFVEGYLGELRLGWMWLDPWSYKSAQLHIVRDRVRAPKKSFIDIAKLFILQLFQLHSFHRLTLLVVLEDHSSLRLAYELGFRQEGTMSEAAWFKGSPRDLVILGALATSWSWR